MRHEFLVERLRIGGRLPADLIDPTMTPEEFQTNVSILDSVDALGGGYVWDAEIFAVTLMEVSVEDDDARMLCGLTGVQQIALDASQLSMTALAALAGIPGLQSLVLSRRTLTEDERRKLERAGLEILEVDE